MRQARMLAIEIVPFIVTGCQLFKLPDLPGQTFALLLKTGLGGSGLNQSLLR